MPTRIKACEVQIVHLRDRFCVFEDNIDNHKVDLDENGPDVPDNLLANWRKIACKDVEDSGQVLPMTDEEQAFDIKDFITEWTKFYDSEWNKPKEDDNVEGASTKSSKRAFEDNDIVMHLWTDKKWHPAKITSYTQTKEAKKDRSKKYGYTVAYICEHDECDVGVIPSKLRYPEEGEVEAYKQKWNSAKRQRTTIYSLIC